MKNFHFENITSKEKIYEHKIMLTIASALLHFEHVILMYILYYIPNF